MGIVSSPARLSGASADCRTCKMNVAKPLPSYLGGACVAQNNHGLDLALDAGGARERIDAFESAGGRERLLRGVDLPPHSESAGRPRERSQDFYALNCPSGTCWAGKHANKFLGVDGHPHSSGLGGQYGRGGEGAFSAYNATPRTAK